MGYEYQLDFEHCEPALADQILRAIPGFEKCTAGLYSFRRNATGQMPDAYAAVEPTGVYVCDNGGAPQIVNDIRAAFVAAGLHAELREL
ncbi:MAG TPA: hypothetical protein VFQ61_01445 [Polyangiaceae bacterium]|nr:hypothetical protein [Polyangiaceae bacterium]